MLVEIIVVVVIMAALWNRACHYIFVLWFLMAAHSRPYQVCSHLPGHLPGVATPVGTCAAKGLVRRQSTKKPIRVFLNRCR